MRIISITLPSNHDMALSGDDHQGSHMCYEDGIGQFIEWVSHKNRYFAKMGDVTESIMVDDKRFDLTNKVPIPSQQKDQAIAKYKPVRKKGKVWLQGNHELKLWKFGNLAEDMAKGLDIPYGTYTAVVEVSDEYGLMYRMFLSHGFGVINSNAKDAEQRKANMMAALKMRLKNKRADCIIMAMGHTHKLVVVPPTEELFLNTQSGKTKQNYLTAGDPTAGYIPPDQRWYINTGSFYRLYNEDIDTSGYGEVKGYDPVELGFPVVKVRDRKPVSVERVIV